MLLCAVYLCSLLVFVPHEFKKKSCCSYILVCLFLIFLLNSTDAHCWFCKVLLCPFFFVIMIPEKQISSFSSLPLRHPAPTLVPMSNSLSPSCSHKWTRRSSSALGLRSHGWRAAAEEPKPASQVTAVLLDDASSSNQKCVPLTNLPLSSTELSRTAGLNRYSALQPTPSAQPAAAAATPPQNPDFDSRRTLGR